MSIGVLEGEEKESGAEKVLEEMMAENSPNLAKETYSLQAAEP